MPEGVVTIDKVIDFLLKKDIPGNIFDINLAINGLEKKILFFKRLKRDDMANSALISARDMTLLSASLKLQYAEALKKIAQEVEEETNKQLKEAEEKVKQLFWTNGSSYENPNKAS